MIKGTVRRKQLRSLTGMTARIVADVGVLGRVLTAMPCRERHGHRSGIFKQPRVDGRVPPGVLRRDHVIRLLSLDSRPWHAVRLSVAPTTILGRQPALFTLRVPSL